LSADAQAANGIDAAPQAIDERRLARGALRILAVLAPPVLGVAYFVAGSAGAISALIGLSFVLVMFSASGAILAWVSARSSGGQDAATDATDATDASTSGDLAAGKGVGLMVLGAAVRLPLYIVALVLLERVSWIHGRSLAAATAIAVVVTLAYELRLIATMPRLFWVDPAAGSTSAAPTDDTRSDTL
jgi:hypothetical protein